MQKKSPCRTSCKCGQFTGFFNEKTDRTFRWTKQRVALARCLLRDKPILLLDEPFSALDPKLRIEMQDLMDQLCEEKKLTMLLVTHQPKEIERHIDRVIEIHQGKSDLISFYHIAE